jgi:putative intracellular protease/amidase
MSMAKKRVLVVITNEAFIPSREQQQQLPYAQQQQAQPTPTTLSYDTESFTYLEALKEQSASSNRNYTGVDVYELTYIWQMLRQQMNMPIDFASPRGGPAAADPVSIERLRKDEKVRRQFTEDHELLEALGHTYPFEWIKAEDYACVVILGCHGAMFDLSENRQLERLVNQVYERQRGLVCTIGHGAAALINIKRLQSNEFLVKNKKMTCFSDREERDLNMEKLLPFLLEDRLKERGAKLEIAEPNKAKVVVDERLISAQNPQSIKEFIEKIVENLKQSQVVN